MAQSKVMRYGIMSNHYEKNILRKMAVPENNIYHASRGMELLHGLSLGDGLCVASVKSFALSAYDLVQKLQYLSNRGIDFASNNEKYLNFSAIHAMPDKTQETIRNIAQRECEFVRFVQNSRINQETKAQIIRRIQWESLTDIVMIFNSNGIKKKGN